MPSLEELTATIRLRVQSRLTELGLTPITAALAANLPRDAIRNLFRGETGVPRADTLVDIAQALGTTAGFLLGETEVQTDGLSGAGRAMAQARYSNAYRRIDVIAEVVAGGWSDVLEQAEDALYTSLMLDYEGSLVSVKLIDGSGGPKYPPGCFCICTEKSQDLIAPGDDVLLVKERDGLAQYTVCALEVDFTDNQFLRILGPHARAGQAIGLSDLSPKERVHGRIVAYAGEARRPDSVSRTARGGRNEGSPRYGTSGRGPIIRT